MGMDPLEDILPFGPFRTFYEDADRDFYVGGLIESEQEGDLGELFSTIILEQFLRLRDSGEFTSRIYSTSSIVRRLCFIPIGERIKIISDPKWFENSNYELTDFERIG